MLLIEKYLAIESVENIAVLGRAVAGADRNPAHVRAPEAERTGPGRDVVVRPDRALRSLGQPGCDERIGDAACQVAHLGKAEDAVILDVGGTVRIDPPAAVEK